MPSGRYLDISYLGVKRKYTVFANTILISNVYFKLIQTNLNSRLNIVDSKLKQNKSLTNFNNIYIVFAGTSSGKEFIPLFAMAHSSRQKGCGHHAAI
jgi:hypothetical protein